MTVAVIESLVETITNEWTGFDNRRAWPARLIILAFGIGKLTHVCHANWRDSANSLRTQPLLLIAPSADGTRLVVFLYPLVCLGVCVWVGVCEPWVIPPNKIILGISGLNLSQELNVAARPNPHPPTPLFQFISCSEKKKFSAFHQENTHSSHQDTTYIIILHSCIYIYHSSRYTTA